jgi:type I restriction enzyme S subunit
MSLIHAEAFDAVAVSNDIAALRKILVSSAIRSNSDFSIAIEPQRCHGKAPHITESEIPASLYTSANYVRLSEIANLNKGSTGIKGAKPGPFPLVVTAEARGSSDHFDVEGPAVLIPMVSSTGHGDASLKRIHFQDGQYAVGSILAVAQPKNEFTITARYIYEYLSAFKDELLVARMVGTANVSLTLAKIGEVPVPIIPVEVQHELERLMRLCDALEQQRQLETAQHAQLLNTLLGTLTDCTSPDELAAHWQRVSDHFDLLLDRPESVDALEQTIVKLAIRGLLTSQSNQDQSAVDLVTAINNGRVTRRKKDAPSIIAIDDQEFLPRGWCVTNIGCITECLDYIRRPIKKSDRESDRGLIPYYGANGQVGTINDYLFDEDLVLVVEDETFIGRIKPFSYVVRGKSWVNNHAHVLRPLGGISVDYLNLCLERYDFIPLTSGTTNRRKLTQVGLLEAKLMIAPLAEQTRIVARVTELRHLCTALRQRLAARQTTQRQLAEALVEV